MSSNICLDATAALYDIPLPSTRTGPLYNAFSYPTKVSPEAIALFIATHTLPGATVLDAFGGSGTTGLAALLCDKPTPGMLELATSLKLNPVWGPRTAHLYEIGSLGSFVAKTLTTPLCPDLFASAAADLCDRAREAIGWMYEYPDGDTIRHVIWTDVLICPHCNAELSFWDAAVTTGPASIKDRFNCQSCGGETKTSECTHATETVSDVFGTSVTQRKRVIARVHGQTGNQKWQRLPTDRDLEVLSRVEKMAPPPSAPNSEIVWGDLRRAGYHNGIDKLHHFYTRRNFIAIATLWDLADAFDGPIRDALRLLILSYNSSHSTLMTRVVAKKGQNDLVLTGSQSGVLYISSLPVEKNVIEGLSRKAKVLSSAFEVLYGSRSQVVVSNQSSTSISLPDGSVDYIFTDPPFGDYIPYAEINQINEIWLKKLTDRSQEVIVSRSQGKGAKEYSTLMAEVFGELGRVLKKNGLATVVFHSAHSEIWRSLTNAYSSSGFKVRATSILDKIQSSFKQNVASVSVKGDPLILLSRQDRTFDNTLSCLEIASMVIQNSAPSVSPQRVFGTFISECLERSVPVTIEAKRFFGMVQDYRGGV